MSLPVLQAERSLVVTLQCVCVRNTQTMEGEFVEMLKYVLKLINPK